MNCERGKRWQHLSISSKFRLVFILLLLLLLLIATTGLLTAQRVRRSEAEIDTSRNIAEKVLEMDRGMERAYRLHGDFFLTYQHIGLQKAHELYAQPSIREIAKVIGASTDLHRRLFVERAVAIDPSRQKDVNLYLASARRFAETSIQSYELLTERAAPQRGLEALLESQQQQININLPMSSNELRTLFQSALDHYREYLVHRQRPHMQSSQNFFALLHALAEHSTTLTAEQRAIVLKGIDNHQRLVEQLLAVDLQLATKMLDFHLQRQTVAPISAALIELTQQQASMAKQQIDNVHHISVIVISGATTLALLILLYIARTIHRSIICNVINLAKAAGEFQDGNLDARVPVGGQDELGRLAVSFNAMAAHLKDLIEHLEQQVVRRTQALAQSEERFRQLVADLPSIAVQGYDQDLNVVYWNRTSETLFGYHATEALGQRMLARMISHDQQDQLFQALKTRQEQDLALSSGEMVMQHKDGHDVPIHAAFVRQEESNGRTIVYCIGIDLAELKRTQARANTSEILYRQLFDHSSSGVVVYEPTADGDDFIIRDLNLASERIERRPRQEVLGRLVSEVFPGLEKVGLIDAFREVHRTGWPLHPPPFYYQDRQVRGWRENRVYRLPSGEIVAVYDDITGQKTAEAEKQALAQSLQRAQKMEALGLMAGGIAHDLNNTLSAIVGYPELLLAQLPHDSPLRKPLGTIREAGERAAAVVADLLTIARGVASTREVVDLNGLVKDWLASEELAAVRQRYPHCKLVCTLSEEPVWASCSLVHIRKCLSNLVGNALESIQGTGTIALATAIVKAPQESAGHDGLLQGPCAVITVTDHGPKIAEKDLNHLFEPFYIKRAMGKTSGTGLGLSVVWNTMKDHGGLAAVTSTEQETTCTLYLPLETARQTAAGENQPTIELRAGGETILVVDDEPHQRELMREMLGHYGYTVICCNSGEEAITYLRDRHADLLILDMVMNPGINGRQTYEEVLKTTPNQKAIIVSGFSESDDVRATLQMGASDFLKKPYTMLDLARAVKRAVSGNGN